MKKLLFLLLVLLGGMSSLSAHANSLMGDMGLSNQKTAMAVIYNIYYILLCLMVLSGIIWGILYFLNRVLDYIKNYHYYCMMKKLSFLERELDKHPNFLLVRANNANANTTG